MFDDTYNTFIKHINSMGYSMKKKPFADIINTELYLNSYITLFKHTHTQRLIIIVSMLITLSEVNIS